MGYTPNAGGTQVLGTRAEWCPERQLGGVEWYPERQLGGVEWCPEASSWAAIRGDVEQSKRLGKQPDEAMLSSRGDARAGKRARTGGAKIAPA
jgi:hypothetical protein